MFSIFQKNLNPKRTFLLKKRPFPNAQASLHDLVRSIFQVKISIIFLLKPSDPIRSWWFCVAKSRLLYFFCGFIPLFFLSFFAKFFVLWAPVFDAHFSFLFYYFRRAFCDYFICSKICFLSLHFCSFALPFSQLKLSLFFVFFIPFWSRFFSLFKSLFQLFFIYFQCLIFWSIFC